MPCYYPVGTYDLDGAVCYRPCGGCIGCRLDYSRSWQIRCQHESTMHDENSFVTLTYNDENLPKNQSLQKKDIVNFIKRLRKELYPKQIRFFGGGEYGNKLDRPHYHLLIFGHQFDDTEVFQGGKYHFKRNFRKNNDQNTIYTSKKLEKIWGKGFITIGEATFESAGYVARYSIKKITGKLAPFHYYGIQPEYAFMSRMPGIGKKWIEKYLSDVYPKDFLTINGIKFQPPLYYDNYYKQVNPEGYQKLKQRRKEKQEKPSLTKDRRRQQMEHYKELITKQLQRKLHNE